MPLYNCEICNYSTKLKYDFNKHLKTKKHQTNYNKLVVKKVIIFPPKPSKILQK